MNTKSDLIRDIIDIEWEMFQTVPVKDRTTCQEGGIDSFTIVRGSMFATWSERTLQSYHSDLVEAQEAGENVMTQKYALMDNITLPLSYNPLIPKIVKMEEKWQAEITERYPHLVVLGQTSGYCGAPGTESCVTFNVYRESELQTYSDTTLQYLYEHMTEALREGKNLSEELYTNLYGGMGYSSLDEAEEALSCKK